MEALLSQNQHFINYFKARQSLELTYSLGLNNLALKQNELERRDDDQRRPLTTNSSWNQGWMEIKLSTLEASKQHKANADSIETLLNLMQAFDHQLDRRRKRIKEDLRSSSDNHSEYLATTARLSRAYLNKVEEVQNEAERDLERDRDAAISRGESYTSGGSVTSDDSDIGHKRRGSSSSSRGGGGGGGDLWEKINTPTIISGATSSSTSSQTAYRDPPKASVFDSITSSLSKKDWSSGRVNLVRAVGQLASKAESVAVGKSSSSPAKESRNKSNTGRLRREAEQADRDYRSAIFRLETLRLQKERVQRSSIESLRESALEMSSLLRNELDQYCSSLETLGHNTVKTAQKMKQSVEFIFPEIDSVEFIRRCPEPPPPEPPIYYVNAFVGECKNLIFGVSLTDYVSIARDQNQLVPRVVSRCIHEIEARGLNTEGIYRVSGKLSTIQQLVSRIEKDEENFQFDSQDDPATVAAVLKLYLRQLPFPLFPFPTQDRVNFSEAFKTDSEHQLASLARRIRRLPTAHQATLKALTEHLAKVVEHEIENKMGLLNLGIVFSAVVFGEDESATLDSLMKPAKDIVMQILIQQHSHIFGNLLAETTGRLRSSSNISTASSSNQLAPSINTSIVSPSPSPSFAPSLLNVKPSEQPLPSPVDSLYELYRDSGVSTLPTDSPSITVVSEPSFPPLSSS